MEDVEIGTDMNANPEFWFGKRVVLTGHTGFKGAWMALWLNRLGAQVTGIGLMPETHPNLFDLAGIGSISNSLICDIRNSDEIASIIFDAQPEVVFHLAAQSLVLAGYDDPVGTFSTNIQGTANVLDSLRFIDSVKVVVAVTTDKVYRNLEQKYPFRETDELGGLDPYSSSKAAAEIVISSFRDSFLKEKGMAVASTRAGNVIGGGDWSKNRLLPDAMRAWQKGEPLEVRRPNAVRPWQHVLEPLGAYIQLAELLWGSPFLAGAYNIGPMTHEAASVQDVIVQAQHEYGTGQVIWGNGFDGPEEAGWLSLETAKLRNVLGLAPRWSLTEAVRRSIHWYRRLQEGADAYELCSQDITDFEQAV